MRREPPKCAHPATDTQGRSALSRPGWYRCRDSLEIADWACMTDPVGDVILRAAHRSC